MQPENSPAPSVRSVDEADADVACATIVLAFSTDPATRWTWPRADDFL